MIKKNLPNFLPYFIATTIILGWWYTAFILNEPKKNSCKTFNTLAISEKLAPPKYLSYLSTLDRDLVQSALAGNTALMVRLISDWDIDAEILEDHGFNGVKRLNKKHFLKAQMYGRQLAKDDPEKLEKLRDKYCKAQVQDDNGIALNLTPPPKRFLPQTYIFTSYLLALTDPENIVAIPSGYRNQKTLSTPELTARIPLDIDRYNGELIFQSKPDVAFVAHYSDPSTLSALRNQGIPLFTLKGMDTFDEITDAIKRIGHVVHRPVEAELLTLFMEAALLAIDNRLLAISHPGTEEENLFRIMFVNYHTQFSLPTEKTITGQLLKRLTDRNLKFISLRESHPGEWMIPIEQEQIVNFNPDCLIISTSNKDALKDHLTNQFAFQNLSATKKNSVYFIDANPHAPTQYFVLAYLDIADSLVAATNPYEAIK